MSSHLSYEGLRTFSWSVFADVSCAHATADNPSKRLLQRLDVHLVPSIAPGNYVDKESLTRLMALQSSEINLKVLVDEWLIYESCQYGRIEDALFPLLSFYITIT